MVNEADIRETAHGQTVIIYGDCWPEMAAVQYVVKTIHPECLCEVAGSLTGLLQFLTRTPDALLILCLRPREHIYLFYVLKEALLNHPALVISDEFFFSDRLVLQSWGGIPFMPHRDITPLIRAIQKYGRPPHPLEGKLSVFLSAPTVATGFFAVPMIFNSPERLMNYMSLLLHRAITYCGITPVQQKLLNEIYKGKSTLSGMAGVMNMNGKKISQEKERILTKLGMNNRMYALLHGTRFCAEIQRTAFITPDKIQRLSLPKVVHTGNKENIT
ncbi:transcriptional regulator [Salmonella enterica]|nr:transcriptional regulator [Salmonella enterica]EHF6859857.1 transcriptional regulator [Salmonella enterica subsp. enterica serovar Panama]